MEDDVMEDDVMGDDAMGDDAMGDDAMNKNASPSSGSILDVLEQLLRRDFGLTCAASRAAELLAPATQAAAEDELRAAREARRQAIDGGATLAVIDAAGEREHAAQVQLERLALWRGRGAAKLAIDVFVASDVLEVAADPRWRPGPLGQDLPLGLRPPAFLRQPGLRIAGHFEPEVDLLIHDPELATLGMVQILAGTAAGSSPPAIRKQVREFVDRATYLRHLLLTDREDGDSHDRQVLTVELVLVYESGGDDGEGTLYEVGEILRDLALETNCLHAIGVNLLARGPAGFDRADLRRAFAWLLHDSRRWFERLRAREDEAVGRWGRLVGVELDEYRLSGRRSLVLEPEVRLHLLHGHNGSGKSSLVEAIELLVTGAIERLAGIDDYEAVVRNRWAQAPTRITLRSSTGEVSSFALAGAARPPAPLIPGARAASFRLDQTVMDRLARASDVDRAAELLAAFFADEAELRERWHAAVGEAELMTARLPARIRGWLARQRRDRQDLHDVVVEQLAAFAEGRVERGLLDVLLPAPLAELRVLRGLVPEIGELEGRLDGEGDLPLDERLFAGLEAGLEGLMVELDERIATVESVLRSLERLGGWWQMAAAEPPAVDDLAAAVDEWSELSALTELAARQLQVLEVLAAARADGWDDRRLDEAGAAAGFLRELATVEPGIRGELEDARGRWQRRRDELERVLQRRPSGDATATATAARVYLADDEVAALDRFGRWWAPAEGGRARHGLGQQIRAAIEDDEARWFESVRIGEVAWVAPLRKAAQSMLAPLRTLRTVRDAQRPPWAQAVAAAIAEDEPGPAVAGEGSGDRGAGMWSAALAEATPTTTAPPRPAARGETSRAASLGLSAEGGVAETSSTPGTGGFRLLPLDENPGARRHERFHHGLLAPGEHGPGARAVDVDLGLATILERLRQAHEASLAARAVGARVQDSFVSRLAARDERALGLLDALNELMALFTPARWAYEDVTLRFYEQGEVSGLRFETGEPREAGASRARADLRLNTAQLSAFTLALFLLCAPRVANPLGLLILDDPLQNMDELTVTTLARGLGKLLRVLPERWSLMMLFHGEGDLARFHDEVECGVYFLPWLSPTVRAREVEIRCRLEDSRMGVTRQGIAGLVAIKSA